MTYDCLNILLHYNNANFDDDCSEEKSLEVQWNLCIMDTLGPTKGVQIIKVSRLSRCPDFPDQFIL